MLKRIKTYIDSIGVSVAAFERSIGMSNASFGKSLKQGGAIGSDKLENILKVYPSINPEWLLTGFGEMTRPENRLSVVNEPTVEYGIKAQRRGLPFIPTGATAGYMAGDSQAVIEKDLVYYDIPEFNGKADFIIKVEGVSMQPKYLNGDLVACKRITDRTFIQWNRTHVVDTNQGPMLKRIKPSEEKGKLFLVSDNQDYPPILVNANEIRHLALVVGLIRSI